MLCIICNENPEKSWPKRWQCWKENGKFSESLCKLLGLPTFPYKADFQNSVYCSSCQKRVYNVYLMVRKWDKLQEDISKLKSRLKKDFQQSLQKSDSSSSEENEKGGVSAWAHYCNNGSGVLNNAEHHHDKSKWQQQRNNDEFTFDSIPLAGINTVIRKRILKRLDRGKWDCDCCCDDGTDGQQHHNPAKTQEKSHCGFPNCQDENCSANWREDVTKNNTDKVTNDEDEASTGSSSKSDWSSHPENKCTDELCKLCCSSEEQPGEVREGQGGKSGHNDPCSSEFCADCSICKDEARKSKKELISKNKRVKTWNDSCHPNDSDKNGSESQTENKSGGGGVESKKEILDAAASSHHHKEYTTKSGGSKQSCFGETTSAVLTANAGFQEKEAATEYDLNEDEAEDAAQNCAERFRCYRANCTRTFVTKEDLDIHVQRHHEGVKCPYVCQQCGKSFQWRRELNSHVLKHSGEVAICCDICGRGFRTKQLFNVHLKTKHGGERKFKCSMCDKSFISESKLNTHLTIHTKVYPFICTICSKGFSAKTFLNFHMSKHMEANPYQCTTCSKTFSSPRNLKVHQYTHNNSHPFKCTICQAGATSETLLKKHMLKHNKEKSNACHICNKRFRFPSSLKKHQKVHSGEKKFKCEFCNKTFIDKYKLTRHLHTHSGDEPFYCTICKQSFATKEYLTKHISNHENELTKDDNTITTTTTTDTSSSSFNPITELPTINPDDLQLLEINDPLSTYLCDGFSQDTDFLENIHTNDDDLVVTDLDLEKFSKQELLMSSKELGGMSQDSKASINLLLPTMLPDFESLRGSAAQQGNNHPFSEFTFH